MASGRQTTGFGASTASGSHNIPSDLPIGEQLMHVDQAITLTLQEIDANFAQAHQIVTGRILPAVKRYGVASARTWQGARFWKHFFEVSANLSLSTSGGDADAVDGVGGDVSGGRDEQGADQTLTLDDPGRPHRKSAHTPGGRSRAAARGGDEDSLDQIEGADDSDDLDASGFFHSLKHARASSPLGTKVRGTAADADESASDASWAPVESPFERLKKEVESNLGASQADTSNATSILEHHRAERARQLASGADASSSEMAPPPRTSAAGGKTPKKGGATPLARRALLNSASPAKTTALPRITATPRGAARRGNPFAPASARKGMAEDQSGALVPPESVRRWDGIADLRKTPLASSRKAFGGRIMGKENAHSQGHQGEARQQTQANDDSDEDDEGSLALPPGMSPPVTMRFSVPQSRYSKTPAKEAARMVVDDLLRTVGGYSPSDHGGSGKRERERNAKPSLSASTGARQLPNAAPSQAAPKSQQRGARPSVVGTPLRKGPVGKATHSERKRRGSLPTPPTLTKGHQNPPPNALKASTTPSAAPRAASNVPGSASSAASAKAPSTVGSSAARLLDEDEGGLGEVQEDEEDEPADLGTGLSRIALTHGADGVDKLLLPADDDESDSDSLSSSEESDGAPTAAGGRQAGGATGDPSGQYSVSGWTASSMASSGSSRARTIDQDTLFGIRPPAQGQSASGAASASGAGRTNHSSIAPTNRGEAKSGNEGFRPWGQVEEQGTVHGGRGLLDERDNTYSAPSPTPAARD
ncbi:hypothetical protein IE81DRAFT_363871 [Ceraceosorus guamensis]|uniref:DASH complex subunit ASK1 n=1 Tax=Ceraceosorus guamensis TaxID=1522189 RepID=A0A316WCN4_9BASI|nr:hypothetical protein IE81DRAFT_363871 [Ceraceosorus guamensis]PWN45633.1 hypothetical protein IE81DRAFT_363871 [Ceraceosorus guamensis]